MLKAMACPRTRNRTEELRYGAKLSWYPGARTHDARTSPRKAVPPQADDQGFHGLIRHGIPPENRDLGQRLRLSEIISNWETAHTFLDDLLKLCCPRMGKVQCGNKFFDSCLSI